MGAQRTLVAFLVAVVAVASVPIGTVASDIDELTRDIENKEAEIDGVQRKISEYEDQIERFEQTERSLSNELGILENRIKKTQLDISQNELNIEKAELELQRLQAQIEETEREIEQTRALITRVLQEMYIFGEANTLEVIFGNNVLSEFFEQLSYLESLQEDLSTSIDRIEGLKTQLLETQSSQEAHHDRLVDMRAELDDRKSLLEREIVAKDVLLADTRQSEEQYTALLSELRAEQQFINAELFRLEERLQNQLSDIDSEPSGPLALSWPVNDPILTATFHDPTYPFRHLFEHSGLDMAIPQGSPVYASAPGYVAFVRTGRSYGNYWMIIHRDGLATLGAHMSQIVVSPDQFVQRGDLIGYSGGLPGTPGAGLSTGPHLHFEVRSNGIPQNPQNYLVGR